MIGFRSLRFPSYGTSRAAAVTGLRWLMLLGLIILPASVHAQDDVQEAARKVQERINESPIDRIERHKKVATELVASMADAKTAEVIESLHPGMRPYLDERQLERELARISSRLGTAKPVETEKLLGVEQKTGMLIEGEFPFEHGTAKCRVQFQDEELLGISVEMGDFFVDTFGAVLPQPELVDHAGRFWNATFIGKPELSCRLMIPKGMEKLFPRERFIELLGRARLDEGIGVKRLRPLEIRFTLNPDHADLICLNVFQLLERTDLRFSTCRTRYEMGERGAQLVKFDSANFDEEYPVSHCALSRKFINALAIGDHRQIISMFHPFDIEDLQPHEPTFEAFVSHIREQAGPLKKFDPVTFSERRTFTEDGVITTRGIGDVEFENLTLQFNILHAFGMVEAFNIDDEGETLEDWAEKLADTSAYEQHGRKVLTELINGDVEKGVSMFSPALQKIMEPEVEKLKVDRNDIVADAGKLKSIKLSSREFLKGSNAWRMNYQIEYEKMSGMGEITFSFNPFGGRIDSFHFNRDTDEDKPMEDKKPADPKTEEKPAPDREEAKPED